MNPYSGSTQPAVCLPMGRAINVCFPVQRPRGYILASHPPGTRTTTASRLCFGFLGYFLGCASPGKSVREGGGLFLSVCGTAVEPTGHLCCSHTADMSLDVRMGRSICQLLSLCHTTQVWKDQDFIWVTYTPYAKQRSSKTDTHRPHSIVPGSPYSSSVYIYT